MTLTKTHKDSSTSSDATQSENAEDEDVVRSNFDRNYASFAPRIRGYLRRLTGGDVDEAEDVTQDVFLAAYNGHRTYRRNYRNHADHGNHDSHESKSGEPSLLAWLMGIARRRWRDKRRGIRLEQTELSPDLSSGEPVDAQVVRTVHLQHCLDRLEPDQKSALLLVFAQGLTYAEAAAELDEPIGTVKWRVHAASRRMREMLRDEASLNSYISNSSVIDIPGKNEKPL